MIGGLARILVVALVAAVLAAGFTVFRIWQEGTQDDRRAADAIVVLGAAQYDGRPSPVFRARLEHAVDLFDAGYAPVLIVTGGKLPGDRTTEAATAREFAIQRGVPAEAILVEDASNSTLESLEGVARIMRDEDLETAMFVSDPTHMLRVLRIARDQGIPGWGSPTTTSPIEADTNRRLRATAHELGALAVYFLTGAVPADPIDPPATDEPDGANPTP
jgi:uncharacterized SAM-binding protein YcdF (DUF218 family)